MPIPSAGTDLHRAPSRRLRRAFAWAVVSGCVAALACDGDAAGPVADRAYIAVSAGFSHTCALRADGGAHCWGDDAAFQLGAGTRPAPCGGFEIPCATEPVAVTGGVAFRAISAGTTFTCAIADDGRAYCWGRNDQDQLGVTGPEEPCDIPPYGLRLDCRETPTPIGGALRFTAIVTGDQHGCALDSGGRAHCWGTNGDGRLGTGTRDAHSQPAAVAGGRLYRMLTAGNRHTCGITITDELFCWGSSANGQIGAGTDDALSPRAVLPALRFTDVSAGGHHTCALTTDAETYCWGENSSGQLGNGSLASPVAPFVLGIPPLTRLASGYEHTCGVTTAGSLLCWGDNVFGQLGDGTAERRLQPTPVSLPAPVQAVDGGWGHTCAVLGDESVWCWGIDTLGQLARGSTSELPQPTPRVIGNQ